MATALNLSDITGTNPAVQAAEIARLRAIFDGIDTDKSGTIDESELLGAMERLGYYIILRRSNAWIACHAAMPADV